MAEIVSFSAYNNTWFVIAICEYTRRFESCVLWYGIYFQYDYVDLANDVSRWKTDEKASSKNVLCRFNGGRHQSELSSKGCNQYCRSQVFLIFDGILVWLVRHRLLLINLRRFNVRQLLSRNSQGVFGRRQRLSLGYFQTVKK